MDDIVIKTAEIDVLRKQKMEFPAAARAMDVTDKPSHASALAFIVAAKRAATVVTDKLDPIIAQANAAHKSLTRLRAELLAPIGLARDTVARKITDYESAERERAAAEERRLALLARQAEDERRLEDAILAEALGDDDAASDILEAPAPPVPIIHVEANISKVEGVSTRRSHKADVIDLVALVQFIAANTSWSHLVKPNQTALNAVVREQGMECKIPGVRVTVESSVVVRNVGVADGIAE